MVARTESPRPVKLPLREYDGTRQWHNEQAVDLLDTLSSLRGETAVPGSVLRTVDNLSKLSLWFSLSRNHLSTTCPDAANKRRRLGNEGIPLSHELKTLVGSVTLEGEERKVMVHTRADREVDFTKLSKALGAEVDQESFFLNTNETMGTANPFSGEKTRIIKDQDGELPTTIIGRTTTGRRIIPSSTRLNNGYMHIVDSDVLERQGSPDKMMTNAGDKTWAVEFHPGELFSRIDQVRKAEISTPEVEPRPLEGPVVIITGNSPHSGMNLLGLFLERLNELAPRASRGDLGKPEIIYRSYPFMGESMELDIREESVRKELLERIKTEVLPSNPGIIVLADNTTDYFANDIRSLISEHLAARREAGEDVRDIRYLSTAEATAALIGNLGMNAGETVALLGVRWVAESDKFSSFKAALSKAGIDIENINREIISNIHKFAFDVKSEYTDDEAKGRLLGAFKNIVRPIESPVVITALTEITELFQLMGGNDPRTNPKSGKLYIDTMKVLADYMAHVFLRREFPSDTATEPYRQKLTTIRATATPNE